MSKVNEIQRRMLTLEGGRFQQLCNAYLLRRGYEQINALGAVIGSDKTRRGTPDTFIPTKSGKFVFAEYTTTSAEKLFGKLKSDIESCLDESVTGVPVEKIDEIVLCHTGQLDPEQHEHLNDLCRGRVNLNVYGIHVIATDLAERFPGIAREHLGVEVDTGQVLPPAEFVQQYGKNTFAAPLDTALVGREAELSKAVERLEQVDVLLVTGPPGVGKTRLALEIASAFSAAHTVYKPWCLLGRGQDLWVDLKAYFSDAGSFVLVADDANRLSRFDYLVRLLQEQRPDQHFKLVATVRDYALEGIRRSAQMQGSFEELAIERLTDEQITKILESDLGIRNFHYLERIRAIAAGNPRLAVMAARIARETNTLASIGDATELYEAYFASIRGDLERLGDPDLLRVGAIVAFFRAVDRSYLPMMEAIERAFGVSPDAFWRSVQTLHALEVVDIHNDEIVRSSDQVLSTYLFYKAFLKDRSLQFSALLEHFFPALADRLVDALSGVFQAFNTERLLQVIRPAVRERWQALASAGNTEALLRFMEIFWFVDPTACLLYAREGLRALEPGEQIDAMAVDLVGEDRVNLPAGLRVLRNLWRGDEAAVTGAIQVMLDWAAKRPNDAGVVVHILRKSYALTPRSALQGYRVERAVLDAIWGRAVAGDLLFARMFIAIAQEHLRLEFTHVDDIAGGAISIMHFELPRTAATLELREQIWNRLFELYRSITILRSPVLDVIVRYTRSGFGISSGELVAHDVEPLARFCDAQLSEDDYAHCLIVDALARWFRRFKVDFAPDLETRFRNPTFETAALLLDRYDDHRDMDYAEYREFKRQSIERFASIVSDAELEAFWEHCALIRLYLERGEEHELRVGIGTLLDGLARRDRELYLRVLATYLGRGDEHVLYAPVVVATLLATVDAAVALTILVSAEYPTKSRWLFAYFHQLPENRITESDLAVLYGLYEHAPPEQVPLDFDALLKFQLLDSRVIPRVTERLLDRPDVESWRWFTLLFNSGSAANRQLRTIFKDDVVLLKRAYLTNLKADPDDDFDGQTLAQLVDLERGFLLEFVEWQIDDLHRAARDPHRGYAFLWRRDDAPALVEQILETLRERDQALYGMAHYSARALFNVRDETADAEEVRRAQDVFLHGMIRKYAHQSEWIAFLFEIIQAFDEARRRESLRVFLSESTDFDVFRKLSLMPADMSWAGSAVPMYRGLIEFYESLLPMVSSLEYLDHRRHLEERIEGLREQVEREERRDFMEDL